MKFIVFATKEVREPKSKTQQPIQWRIATSIYDLFWWFCRDFDENRSFQDLIDRVSYFKNLNINAIQLMPVMEYEGNESWGYNTAFHMALDKFYGTPEKFKGLWSISLANKISNI